MGNLVHSGNLSKSIVKNSSLYFFSSLVTKAASVLLLPIMTRVLTTEDYGVLANLTAFIQFSSVFISLYLDSAFNRFYYSNDDDKQQLKIYISTFYWFILLWGLIPTGALLFTSWSRLSSFYNIDFFPMLVLVSVSPLLLQLSTLGRMYLRNNIKTKEIIYWDLLVFFISTGISLYLIIYCRMGVLGRVIGLTVSYLSSAVYFSSILIKKKLISLTFSRKLIKDSLKFSLPLMPLALASWVTTLSDRIIISYYGNVADSGIYDIAYKIALMLHVVTESIFQVFASIMTSLYTHDIKKFRKTMSKFATNYNFIVLFVAFYLSILSKEIVTVFLDNSFIEAHIFVPIIVLGYYISSHNKYLGTVFGFQKKTYLSSIGYFVQAFINFIINIIFIPVFGNITAAWSTFISLVFLTVWNGFFFIKWEKVKFEWKKLSKTILIFLVAYIGSYYANYYIFKFEELIGVILVKIFISFPIIICGVYLFKIITISDIKKLIRE